MTTATDLAADRLMYRAIRDLCAHKFLSDAHFDLRAYNAWREHNDGAKPDGPADWIWAACMVAKDQGVDVTPDPVGLAAARAEEARWDAIEAARLARGLSPTPGF